MKRSLKLVLVILVLNTILLSMSFGLLVLSNNNKTQLTSGDIPTASAEKVVFPEQATYNGEDYQTQAWAGNKPKGAGAIPGAGQNAPTYSTDVNYTINLNGNNNYVNKALRAKLFVIDATGTLTFTFPNFVDVKFATGGENKLVAFPGSYLPYDGANKFNCGLQAPGVDGAFDTADDDFSTCTNATIGTVFYVAGTRLFRFYSAEYRSHFYTATVDERDYIINNNPHWNYENVAYRVVSVNLQNGGCNDFNSSRIYRFWNEGTRKHFYTISEAEKDNIIANDPHWKFEDRKFCGFAAQYSQTFAKPVYRFYSSVYGGHFYTANETEKQNIINNDPNWKYEGIGYYYRFIFNRPEDQNT